MSLLDAIDDPNILGWGDILFHVADSLSAVAIASAAILISLEGIVMWFAKMVKKRISAYNRFIGDRAVKKYIRESTVDSVPSDVDSRVGEFQPTSEETPKSRVSNAS